MLWLRRYGMLALLPFLAACEKELEYDVSSPNASLVVNSIFAQDSLWQVEVSTTASPGEGQRIKILKDASISIYEDGVRISDIVLDSLDARPGFLDDVEEGRGGTVKFYYHRTETSRGRAGRNYEIRVSHPDYPTVFSTSIIPRAPRVRLLSNASTVGVLVNGNPYSRLSFSIADDGGDNYYGIEVWARKNETDSKLMRVAFYSDDQVFAENTLANEESNSDLRYYSTQSGVFFSNQSFDGREISLDVLVESSLFQNTSEFSIHVLRLSPDLYEFATSYQRQLVNQSNPFAEPAQVYSNIQNGAGIFAGYSLKEVVFR